MNAENHIIKKKSLVPTYSRSIKQHWSKLPKPVFHAYTSTKQTRFFLQRSYAKETEVKESKEGNKGPLIKPFGRVGNNGALKETKNKQKTP